MKNKIGKVLSYILVFAIAVSMVPAVAKAATQFNNDAFTAAAAEYMQYLNRNYQSDCISTEKYYECTGLSNPGNIKNITFDTDGAGNKYMNITADIPNFEAQNDSQKIQRDYEVSIMWDYGCLDDACTQVDTSQLIFYAQYPGDDEAFTNMSYDFYDNVVSPYLNSSMYGYILAVHILYPNLSFQDITNYFGNSLTISGLTNVGKTLCVRNDCPQDPNVIAATPQQFASNSAYYLQQAANANPIQDNLRNANVTMLGSYAFQNYYDTNDVNSMVLTSTLYMNLNADYSSIPNINPALRNWTNELIDQGGSEENTDDSGKKDMSGDVPAETPAETPAESSTEKKTEENPKTGVSLPVTIMLFGSAMAVIIAVVTKKKRKLMKI